MLIMALCAPCLFAQTLVDGRDRVWKVSLASLAAANALDVHSSWGKRELNPTLAGSTGKFGLQGALIKAGLQGGMIGVQYLFLRGRPNRRLERILAIVNFSSSATIGATAIRNYGVPGPPR